MEKPEHTPNCVAELMNSCWKADASERPTFSSMEQALSSQLESSVTSYYLQLSDEYVKMHVERMNSINSLSSDKQSVYGGSINCAAASRPVSTNLYVESPFPSRPPIVMREDRFAYHFTNS